MERTRRRHRQVVLLRSEREDDPYTAAFEEAGYAAHCEPTLDFRQVNSESLREKLAHPTRYGGLILTSPRAADALDDALVWLPGQSGAWESSPAYAVGPRTADKLRLLGFAPEGEESGTAVELASYIARQHPNRPLLFLCGNRRRDELPDQLTEDGIDFEELCVYETLIRRDVRIDAGGVPDWIVFFSPSGVEAVQLSLAEADDAALDVSAVRKAALGPTTAGAVRKAGWQVEAVAEAPTPEALVRAVRGAG